MLTYMRIHLLCKQVLKPNKMTNKQIDKKAACIRSMNQKKKNKQISMINNGQKTKKFGIEICSLSNESRRKKEFNGNDAM